MTPMSGKVGTPVTINISSPYSLDGDYQVLWSSTTGFDASTTMVVATGHVTKGTSSIAASFIVPEAASGIHYVRFVRVLADERFGFYFIVQPGIKVTPSPVKAGNPINVAGTGFSGTDMVTLTLDGKEPGLSARTNKTGSFTTFLMVPDTFSGDHRLLVNTSNGDTITATIGVLSKDTQIVVPPNNTESHDIDSGIDNNNQQPIMDRNPPSPPTPISPMGHSFGFFGTKSVTFTWVVVSDSSGVTYTLEIANDVAFSMLKPGMQKIGLTETSCTVDVPPGSYYWRVKSIDGAGNSSYWGYAPYAFRVAEISALIDELLHFLWAW